MLKNTNIFKYFVFLLFSLTLAGCGSDTISYDEAVSAKAQVVKFENNFKNLTAHVENPNLRGEYENLLHINMAVVEADIRNPQVKSVAESFKKDTTTEGVIYQKLLAKYNGVVNNPIYLQVKNNTPEQLSTIKDYNLSPFYSLVNKNLKSLTVAVYDSHFIDYNNVLAGMSTHVKPVFVDSFNRNAPIGSQFVGNPSYGTWERDNNGNMFWSFFAAYAALQVIDDMGDRYRYDNNYNYQRNRYNDHYRYDNWASTRNYSYSNDYYAREYASDNLRQKYRNYDNSISQNPKYKGKTYKNTTWEQQQATAKVKAANYTPSITKTSVEKNSAGLKSTQKMKAGSSDIAADSTKKSTANKYTPSVTKTVDTKKVASTNTTVASPTSSSIANKYTPSITKKDTSSSDTSNVDTGTVVAATATGAGLVTASKYTQKGTISSGSSTDSINPQKNTVVKKEPKKNVKKSIVKPKRKPKPKSKPKKKKKKRKKKR